MARSLSPSPVRSHDDLEKTTVAHEENLNTYSGILSPEDAEFLASFPDEKRKKILRKIIHRPSQHRYVQNFELRERQSSKYYSGNAKIEGLENSLNMTGHQYNIALAVFFVPYTLAEIPSNIILNRFKRPSTFMGIIVSIWGLVMTCTGFVQGFSGLCITRVLLGLFEAGFFPGAILIISRWYLPHESQTRIAVFFTASAFAGALSGLLAYGIVRMDGVGGYEGWRWIFILEGIASVVAGLACFPLLIDTPALSQRWLDPEEIRYLEVRQVARQARQTEDNGKKFDFRVFKSVLLDWKIYCLILAFWSNVTPNYGLEFTMPQIMKNMGYTSANAQLLTIPAYTVGAISAYGFAVLSDRFRWRMPFIVGPQAAVAVAYAVLASKAENIKGNIPLCYFAVCLACFGYMTCIGNMGGITGSFIFIQGEAPKYQTGFGASMGFASAGIIACLVMEYGLWSINKKNAKFTEDEVRAKYSDDELDRMGDKSPLFKYTL
ncbi:unnamed protein product [Zymoseptoria tritici ST99CH_1E4]|uniref:Major facilitator superfamily (MFS) profile domain-containing protein n=1 Tax=Zymoseptoria tritici ST99CH_1E4 TaxID=1276532 RepID=A0A2H1FYQ4_ZYMTR|nr:unnamed protein product [Zymoseptoria tritici ST99CH_1E4]